MITAIETKEKILIREMLTRLLREGKMTEDDILVYRLFFDALGDDPKVLRESVVNLYKSTGFFGELVDMFRAQDAKNEDETRIAAIRATL